MICRQYTYTTTRRAVKGTHESPAITTLDHPLLIKASQIVKEQKLEVVVQLGGFHFLKSFLGCIGYIMEDSGLAEALSGLWTKHSQAHPKRCSILKGHESTLLDQTHDGWRLHQSWWDTRELAKNNKNGEVVGSLPPIRERSARVHLGRDIWMRLQRCLVYLQQLGMASMPNLDGYTYRRCWDYKNDILRIAS